MVPSRAVTATIVVLIAGSLTGCGDSSKVPEQSSMGPTPTLPEPSKTLLPTVHIATASGWHDNAKPKPAAELSVAAFAKDLDHPRWLYVLPNGDVLVAETNAPPRSEDATGI